MNVICFHQVYAKVNKKRSNKSPPAEDRPFSGIAQVYSPPPQYDSEPPLPPELPPELPPDIPPRVSSFIFFTFSTRTRTSRGWGGFCRIFFENLVWFETLYSTCPWILWYKSRRCTKCLTFHSFYHHRISMFHEILNTWSNCIVYTVASILLMACYHAYWKA